MSEKIGEKIYNYLIGFEISTVNSNKLPSYRDVLNFFMHKHHSSKLTIRNSSSIVISDINAIWAGFSIPALRPQHSIQKIEKFYAEYMKIKKHRSRVKQSKIQRTNVNKFCHKLDRLFDIANCAAVKNLPEGLKNFLFECQGKKINNRLPVTFVSPEKNPDNQSAIEQGITNGDNDNIEEEIG